MQVGRHKHLVKTGRKHDGMIVYRLDKRYTRALDAAAPGERVDPSGGPGAGDSEGVAAPTATHVPGATPAQVCH